VTPQFGASLTVVLESSIMLLELSIMRLELSIMLLELSIMRRVVNYAPRVVNRTGHIRYQCRKTAVLSCYRCLIDTGVEKISYT
jgi:hypothetical protein